MKPAKNVENPFKGMTNALVLEEIKKRGFFTSKSPPKQQGLIWKVSVPEGKKYKFAVISCTQLGSRYQQMTHLYNFYRLCSRRGVHTVFHCGDLVDGEKIYRGHEYELFLHGADAQRKYVIDNYPKYKGITTKVISGNHDLSFWKTGGYNIVKAVCKEREDMEFLGDNLAYIEVDSVKIAIMHGTGGVAYARSYKLQKIIENIAPETKPHLLFLGHYHVPAYIPQYRNVEGWQMGCFQSQTPYLMAKGLYPVVAGLVVEMVSNDKGLVEVVYKWEPYYVMKKDDF